MTPRPLPSVCIRSSMLSIGSPKNWSPPCCFERQQAALDGADAGGGDVAVFGGEVLGVVADMLQHGAQVLEVEQQQAAVVGDLEHQRAARLACVSFRLSRRASSSGPMSEMVARTGWPCSPNTSQNATGYARRLRSRRAPSSSRRFGSLATVAAGCADAGQVALDVGHEHRHADARKAARPATAA